MIYLLAIAFFVVLLAGLAALLGVAERRLLHYGTCAIHINGGERKLSVEGGQSLLSALYAGEVFIPSACGGKGTCGFCKVALVSGGGPVLPTELPYLTRRERRTGVRLACQVKVREDIEAWVPEEYLNVRLYRAEVVAARGLTHDTREIRLKLLDPPAIEFRPGQYVQLRVPVAGEGAPDRHGSRFGETEPVWRAYSVSSPPHEEGAIELIARLVPGGAGSTYLHGLRVGESLVFAGPFGDFVLDDNPAVEIVCVAGGCGMAPIKSIIHTLYEQQPERSCRLFFGCRTARDLFHLAELEQLAARHPNFHLVVALSEAAGEAEWTGETGFIHLAVDKHLTGHRPRQAFLCGPEPMVDAVTAVLKTKGLTDESIFADTF